MIAAVSFARSRGSCSFATGLAIAVMMPLPS
jgi:hypothetical protein